MDHNIKDRTVTALAELLDIPDSTYEAAASRYHDLGAWLGDKSKAKSSHYNPHVYPQGSFRLGTAIKPWKR